MQKRAFVLSSLAFVLVLAGCGGGGGGSSAVTPPAGGSGDSPQAQNISSEDLFSLNGSDLLSELEADAGASATSSVGRYSQSSSAVMPQSVGPFTLQITGGTATVARPGNKNESAIGYLMTFRDASGLCECSADNHTLAPPYKTSIANPLWLGGKPFLTQVSATTLGIGNKNGVDSSNHGGTYTATVVPNPPGGTANFTIATAVSLPRQNAPAISFAGNAAAKCPSGAGYLSWSPAAGTSEYFIAFLTHLKNDPVHNPAFTVVGFVLTDKTYTCVAPGNFYSGAHYQAFIIASDTKFIGIYDSQGKVQAPKLPPQIDFTVSPITSFTTP